MPSKNFLTSLRHMKKYNDNNVVISSISRFNNINCSNLLCFKMCNLLPTLTEKKNRMFVLRVVISIL